MSERTFTEAEIREATARVGEQLYGEPWDGEDRLINELMRPEIHPDVPVMYEHEPTRGRVLCFAEALESDKRRLQILIPEDKVREWGDEWGCGVFLQTKIDEYRRTGK